MVSVVVWLALLNFVYSLLTSSAKLAILRFCPFLVSNWVRFIFTLWLIFNEKVACEWFDIIISYHVDIYSFYISIASKAKVKLENNDMQFFFGLSIKSIKIRTTMAKAFAHSSREFCQFSVRSRRWNEIRHYWKTFTLFDIDNLSIVFLLLLLKHLWCEAPKDCSGYISKKKIRAKDWPFLVVCPELIFPNVKCCTIRFDNFFCLFCRKKFMKKVIFELETN